MRKQELTGYPSIDKPWLKYYSEEAINAPLPACTVFENIYTRNKGNDKEIALKYYGKKITFSDLFVNVEKAKRSFEQLGVKKGDIVVMITSSTPETIYSVLALCRIGAVANIINPFFEPQQMIDRISETDAKIMIVLDQLYKNIAEFIERIPVKRIVVIPVAQSMPLDIKVAVGFKLGRIHISFGDSILLWNDFIKIGNHHEISTDAEYEKDRPFIMVYSSGTTGASKGIVLTNSGINTTVSHYYTTGLKYSKKSTMLQMIPVWFSTGIVFSVIMPLSLGITVVLEPVFSEKVFVKDLVKYKPNMVLTATSLWVYACTCSQLQNANLSHLTIPITGGEKITAETENQINNFLSTHNCNHQILKGYGMCELGSTVTADSQEVIKIGSVGFPINKVVVAAFDQDTNKEMKYCQRGEIRVLSPARMKEYFKNPKATADFFRIDENGNTWGCTGDIGYVDENGFVYILGRTNDCYTASSGKRVYCFDIEDIILRHKDIERCKVVGVVHDGNECAIAHIVIKKGGVADIYALLTELRKLCDENLSQDSMPLGFVIQNEMPIKNSGKLDVEKLKKDTDNIICTTEVGIRKITINNQ